MIADVNERWSLAKFAGECAPEQNELVEVSEPFPDEAAGKTKTPEERLRSNYLRLDSRGGQSIKHHHRESLHALLAFERVITDQQNHQDELARPRRCATARRSASAALFGGPDFPRAATGLPSASSYCRRRDRARK